MKRLWQVGLILLLCVPLWGNTAVFANAPTTSHQPTLVEAQEEALVEAQELLDAMSVEERVGQLFLVTFEGSAVDNQSDIADLILNYHVGGVVLQAENDNIEDLAQLTRLTNDLQSLALTGTTLSAGDPITPTVSLTMTAVTPTPAPTPTLPDTPLPLLIAINHEGDGAPYSEILSELTAVPNNMAIGATWQPQNAQIVGEIVGRELTSIGVNMLFGPSLDVLENPDPAKPADLGTRSFGGDPYWVALMGQAYISGLHIGSANRLAVVAKHFPGVGSSDRPIAEEVPTVRKSLAELERVELAPFFAVTGGANQPTAVADALLATHARYQNFQGNISATTPPVSFDPQALTSLMSLPQFSQWRQNGGIIVSDALGQRSVQRFYDDTNQEFPHRRVARDALLAGNDLLYLDNFALGSDPSYEAQLANLRDTVLWFQERYLTDLPFQQRVDQAVLRIIQLKLKLYEADFNLDNVLLDGVTTAVNTPTNNAAMFDLGQSAVTLISPDPVELASRLSSPPNSEERILIFTDMRYSQQCAECAPEPYISATALEETILLLYGANASNQVRANQISSFTFDELAQFLTAEPDSLIYPPPATAVAPEPTATRDLTILPDDLPDDSPTMTPQPTATPQPTPTPSPAFLIQEGLNEADWIIFALLDVDEAHQTLNNFLAARPDLVRSSKVIVFAYNAPYYLDTTEISKLTAYFGVYSKIPTFVNASVRALFQESPLLGLPPVDVAGIGYHLAQQVQPSPNQVIELYVVDEGTAQSPPSEAPLPAEIGDTLHLQTGIIRDHNGNPVPDGTIVQFIQQDRIQGVVSIVAERTTQQGVATLDYVLEARTGAGQFRITAVSGTATASQEVDITIADAAQVAVITPTPTPTATATPSPTSTATPTPTATAVVPTSTPSPAPLPEEPGIRINLSDLQMVLALMVGLVTTLGLGVYLSREAALVQRVRWPLWGIVGGLLVYIYYQLELPGTAVVGQWGSWGGLLSTLLGGLLGLLLFALYKEIQPDE